MPEEEVLIREMNDDAAAYLLRKFGQALTAAMPGDGVYVLVMMSKDGLEDDVSRVMVTYNVSKRRAMETLEKGAHVMEQLVQAEEN